MKKDIIPFTDTATPRIADYQANYAATHDEYPDVKLFYIDLDPDSVTYNCRIESMQRPHYTLDENGLIDTIVFMMDGLYTGYIILN